MYKQNLSVYGIECSDLKRQIVDDGKFLKAFIPRVIHDNELDSLYDSINDFSLNIGHGSIEQAAILGFKYQGAMFFTANIPENRLLLDCVGFREDRNIALPFKSLNSRKTTICIGNRIIEPNIYFFTRLTAITMECICANSPNYVDQQALGTDFWCRKKNLQLAIDRQMISDCNARVRHVKRRSI